jgi:hypothetical protein
MRVWKRLVGKAGILALFWTVMSGSIQAQLAPQSQPMTVMEVQALAKIEYLMGNHADEEVRQDFERWLSSGEIRVIYRTITHALPAMLEANLVDVGAKRFPAIVMNPHFFSRRQRPTIRDDVQYKEFLLVEAHTEIRMHLAGELAIQSTLVSTQEDVAVVGRYLWHKNYAAAKAQWNFVKDIRQTSFMRPIAAAVQKSEKEGEAVGVLRGYCEQITNKPSPSNDVFKPIWRQLCREEEDKLKSGGTSV